MARLGDTVRRLAQLSAKRPSSSSGNSSTMQVIEEFGANPGGLRMRLHVPADLQPGSPLVVVLHGCTQSAEGYARGAGWMSAADRFGFALLCPEQTANNNPNLCFNWFVSSDTRRGAGEAASIAAMIDRAVELQKIDPQRIFITGLSAGGAMANVMLSTYPEVFKGGAIIAGLPYAAANGVAEAFAAMAHQRRDEDEVLGDRVRSAAGGYQGPWPTVSVWHGDADATVSPAAGDAIARQWANLHNVSNFRSRTEGASIRREWRSESGAVVVEHVSISGMGHGTPLRTSGPDGLGLQGPYLLDVGISSTLAIVSGWGIADSFARADELPAPASAPVPVAADLFADPLPALTPALRGKVPQTRSGRIDVADVINSALRTAGLLK